HGAERLKSLLHVSVHGAERLKSLLHVVDLFPRLHYARRLGFSRRMAETLYSGILASGSSAKSCVSRLAGASFQWKERETTPGCTRSLMRACVRTWPRRLWMMTGPPSRRFTAAASTGLTS